MYCDTDSVIYTQPKRDGPTLIETEEKLGGLTYELGPLETIMEFVCGVPKNYAYRVLDTGDGREKTVCKVRSKTLNCNASKMLNFDVIRNMILRGSTEPSNVNLQTDGKIKRKNTGRRQRFYCHRIRG